MTRLIARTARLSIASICLFLIFAGTLRAQTYSLGGDAPDRKAEKTGKQQPAQDQSLGWGSNIQNARIAHAAEQALARGDYSQAVAYAQRATQAVPTEPHLWFLLGYAARLDGKLSLAMESYQHGLRLLPSSLEGMSGLAQTYSMMGRTADAEGLLKQVLAVDPRRKDDALVLGNLYLRAGDYTSALEWLQRAERLAPGARSELLIALCYEHLGQLDQASRYLEMARHRSPDDPDVQRSLAAYYREVGNYPLAVKALESIKRPRPDVIAELAYTYQLDGRLDDAAKTYALAATALPKDMGLQVSAAQAQVAAGAVNRAAPFLARAATIDPDYYRLHAVRGEIAQIEERNEDAVKEYQDAIAHLPDAPVEGPLYGIQLHMDLVQLYRGLRSEADAARQLTIAEQQIGAINVQGPGRPDFLRLRALVKMNAGQPESALKDIDEAVALRPRDKNNLQLDGDLLMKLGKPEDAIAAYKRVLAVAPDDRFALTSLGYASRAAGRDQDAEKYFLRLARTHPGLYVPYLALGDLYTAKRELKKADASYEKAYALAPQNALVVAGGMNAAIEAHNIARAGEWYAHATEAMDQEPTVLREKERYLSFKGDYLASAAIGQRAIQQLPEDRDVVVYLGYDLLHLQRYDELLQLTGEYTGRMPKEPDLPLLSGYVHKAQRQPELAEKDFTEALERDPSIVTAYVNRGFVYNDLHRPKEAAADFEAALKREPGDGEAHLGLAYADLDLHKPQAALHHADLAQQLMGESKLIHLIRATAYGREGMLAKAAGEYRAAIRLTPDDGTLYYGLGSTLYSERRYQEAVNSLKQAERLSPGDANVYALLARSYAQLNERDQTLRYVDLAEQRAKLLPAGAKGTPSSQSAVYVATGEALNTLGDQKAAMERFRQALIAPESDRVTVRLAIAQLMAQRGEQEDAERQIALAQMEGDAGVTAQPTGEQLIAAADVFRGLHDYQLSQNYLGRAKQAGAPDTAVRLGLANNYLALGDTRRASAELSALKSTTDEPDYQVLLAQASLYQQEHQNTLALTAFAQAANAAGDDQTAQQSLLVTSGNEGVRVTPELSLLSNFSVAPIFEDTTVYVLDSKLDQPVPVPPADTALLPLPRSSLETEGTAAYHLHLGQMPPAAGFFQVRNARGTISVPSTSSVVNRNTTDYTFNFGLDPTLHLGNNAVTLNGGLQTTLRRDANTPVQLNQNLLREFLYVSTSSFFNALALDGYVLRESGPFTNSNLHSRAVAAGVDFRVGEPWGKTALVTGWGFNDQQFSPVGVEAYYTSSYIGLTRKFAERLTIRAIVEDLRAWRVVGPRSGIAQALRPSGSFDLSPARNWDLQGTFAYSSTRGFHVYDAYQFGASVSYTRALSRSFREDTGEVRLRYPIRFSGGFQQENFFNFGSGKQQLRPYVSITLF